MYDLFKRKLSVQVWDVLRYFKFRFLKRGRFALNNLDKKLEKYLFHSGGFFVELGANDGYTQSNTLFLEKKRGWRGVLVEPSPYLFSKLCYFRGCSKNHLFCCACAPFGYSEKYVDIDYAGLMSISSSLDLDLKDKKRHLKSQRKNLLEMNVKFGALAKPLSLLLDESQAPREIDLLSLDVEGAELDVLKGIDFNKYSFKYMLIECRDLERLEAYLSENGYSLVDQLTHHDYLFSKRC